MLKTETDILEEIGLDLEKAKIRKGQFWELLLLYKINQKIEIILNKLDTQNINRMEEKKTLKEKIKIFFSKNYKRIFKGRR